MHTDETDDVGDAPKMPPVGTRVRIKPDEAAAVARQTLDSEPRDSDMVQALTIYLSSATGIVSRAAHTNGDIRFVEHEVANPGFTAFAYGAQVEPIE
jgi:hypothetical protein